MIIAGTYITRNCALLFVKIEPVLGCKIKLGNAHAHAAVKHTPSDSSGLVPALHENSVLPVVFMDN